MHATVAAGMLNFLPNFNAGVHTLYTLLLLPAAVIMIAGSYFHVGRFYVGRQAMMVPLLLGRIFLTVLTILCFGDWGNLLLQVVNGVPQEMGMNWSGADPGTTYEDYRTAIANEFGTNSVAAGQKQLYQTVRSQGTYQSQAAAAGASTTPAGPSLGGGTGIVITRYGYQGDPNGDTNSGNPVNGPYTGQGIGNHNNPLVEGQNGQQSISLSPDVAQQYGLQVGQTLSVQLSNGQTVTGQYDDSTDSKLTGRVDLYDPQGLYTGINGVSVTGINGLGYASVVNAPNATPMGGTDAPGWIKKVDDLLSSWILAPIAYGLSIAASWVMWFMSGIQEFFFLMEVAVSPIFVAMLMVPALVPVASRFITGFVSICVWPLGWVIADLVTKGLIDLAVNPNNNAALAVFDGFGGAYAIWFGIAVWVIFSSFLGPFIAAAAFVSGSSGTAALIGATFGAAVSTLSSKALLQALMMGGAGLRGLGSLAGQGGGNGAGNGNGASPAPMAAPTARRPTYARRPTRQEEEGA
jgi:hypothetical protein